MKYERYVFREHNYKSLDNPNKLTFSFKNQDIKLFWDGHLFCYYNVLTQELTYQPTLWFWK